MTAWRPDVVPMQSDRAAGDRFITLLRSVPEDVLVPSHPYYLHPEAAARTWPSRWATFSRRVQALLTMRSPHRCRGRWPA